MVASPRATVRSYPVPPPVFYGDIDTAIETAEGGDFKPLRELFWQFIEWQRLASQTIALLSEGKDNATGLVTLTASSTTTALVDRRIGAKTKVVLVPTTASALADIPWQTFPNTVEGQAVLNHANDTPTDRTFGYALRG